ncbi:unnamed protein product [Boreogadus saida]
MPYRSAFPVLKLSAAAAAAAAERLAIKTATLNPPAARRLYGRLPRGDTLGFKQLVQHPTHIGGNSLDLVSTHGATILPWCDAHATIRAQAGKKRDYSLLHTPTSTQIAESPQTLNSPQTLSSPPDTTNTVARGMARNGHLSSPPPDRPPPPPWPTNVSLIASPSDRLITPETMAPKTITPKTMAPKTITPKTMAPLPHHHTDIDDEYL